MNVGAALALLAFGAGAVALVMAGMAQRGTLAVDDPEAYLHSLDDLEEIDEFQQILAEPFLTRVLRPFGSRALGGIAGLLPSNYRDGIRQKLVYPDSPVATGPRRSSPARCSRRAGSSSSRSPTPC